MATTIDMKEPLIWLKIIEKMGQQKSYKPILLLSIISEIEKGRIEENKVKLDDIIASRFSEFYSDIDNEYATTQAYLPFFYLQKDVWAEVKWVSGANQKRPGSNKSAKKNIEYVEFEPELFQTLLNPELRELVKERLYLKAEEDIKRLDPKDNEPFTPPNNIPDQLEKHFGKLSIEKINRLYDNDYIDLEFAQENLLKEVLVDRWDEIREFQKKNLQIFGGPSIGVEYNTHEAGFIDILAEDKHQKKFTVIELKKGISGERHFGQLLRYIGWVRGKIAIQREVNGILLAANFPESINFSKKELPLISLMIYDLKFQIRPF